MIFWDLKKLLEQVPEQEPELQAVVEEPAAAALVVHAPAAKPPFAVPASSWKS